MNYIINYFTIQYFDLSLAVQPHFVISKNHIGFIFQKIKCDLSMPIIVTTWVGMLAVLDAVLEVVGYLNAVVVLK